MHGKKGAAMVATESTLSRDLQRVREVMAGIGREDNALLVETIHHLFSREGKGLRPTLVLLCARLLGGEEPVDERLVRWAAVAQIVHTASLVHDDTIDEAAVRRGATTINAAWSGHVAILVGDYLFAQSAFMAASLGDVRVMVLLAETIKDLCRGEILQLESGFGWDQSEELYLEKIRCKTASLLALCTEGAAILFAARPEQVAALRAFGLALGQAFQIADDILDIVGSEQTLGKPAGSDLRHGTVTLPIIYYLRDLRDGDPRRDLLTSGEHVDEALALLRASPALDAARARAREFLRDARAALAGFAESPGYGALLELTDGIIARDH
ncbi:MAG: hypothetical protein NVSMB65_08360 [Chloroflexota bacterium]